MSMRTRSILIVEDEAIVALDLETRLMLLGYRVVGCAATGEAALVLAQQHRPDLALMDIRLQGPMDGIATARRIQQLLHIPVIFLTAHLEESTLREAQLADPFGYLPKPFEDAELERTLADAFDRPETALASVLPFTPPPPQKDGRAVAR